MNAVTGFRTPEEAALELELPLLGTLPRPLPEGAAVAANYPHDERERREYLRAAERVLRSPRSEVPSIGIVGDVTSARRARVAAYLAASIAPERAVILVDADLRGAHLSFDDRGRAQEGLVDVLRYGVRSPRVVAPTSVPGLSLLPVGSGTVDIAGTFGSESTIALFGELARSGDLVIVHAPDPEDLTAAGPFLAQVSTWILVHEIGVSDSERTRTLRDAIGQGDCLGVLAIEGEVGVVEAPAPARREPHARHEAEAPASVTSPVAEHRVEVPPADASSPDAPPVETPPLEVPAAPVATAPPPPPLPPRPPRREPEPEPVVEAIAGTMGAPAPEPEAVHEEEAIEESFEDWDDEPPRGRTGRTIAIVGAGLAVVLLLGWWARSSRETSPELATGPVPTGEPTLPAAPPPPTGEAEPATVESLDRAAEETALPSPTPTAAEELAEVVEAAPAAAEPAAAATRDEVAAEPASAAAEEEAVAEATPAPPIEETPQPAPRVERPVAATGPLWSVHVASVKTEAGARQEAEAYIAKGWPVTWRQEEVPDKGLWYRLYVGPYGDRARAREVAAEIEAAGLSDWTQVRRVAAAGETTGTGREDR